MLTPVEIQSKSFKSGGLGYDKKDVDAFMREVLSGYEELYRENMEQKDKLQNLKEGIQYYKTIEKTLQKALVLAEKTAEDTKIEAAKEAKRIEKEATMKANIILADAKNELESLHQQTVSLIQQYEKYKAQFRNLAKAQLELLETEAFNINVARLDAFIDVNPQGAEGQVPEETISAEETADFTELKKNIENAVSKNESVSDIIAQAKKAVYEDDGDAFASVNDLSGYEVEGQEEFDYLDLNDPES